MVHSAAQFTCYFLLGLTAVSLLIWFYLFLASKTAALQKRIDSLREQCTIEEQRIAESVRKIASATSIEQAETHAQSRGFTSHPRVVYVNLTEEEQGEQSLAAASAWPGVAQEDKRKWTSGSSSWQTLLRRLRGLLTSLPRAGRVAHLH